MARIRRRLQNNCVMGDMPIRAHQFGMNTIEFFVPGIAKSAGSKRAFVITPKGGGRPRAIVTDDCKGSKDWKGDVKRFASDAFKGPLLECPLHLTLVFCMPRPQFHLNKNGVKDSAPKFPAKKPDADKLSRAVMDSLTGVIWKDDAQVTTKLVKKRFADSDPNGVWRQVPGVAIKINEDTDQ